jgi:cyclic pyranopterin phosphate synthase
MDEVVARDGAEESTTRRREARSRVMMLESTARLVESNSLDKGDVLAAARFAGVQAAKDSASHLPLLDPHRVKGVKMSFVIGDNYIDVQADLVDADETSSWMPALTAATVASLTIFDMCKAVDRTMSIGPVELYDLD